MDRGDKSLVGTSEEDGEVQKIKYESGKMMEEEKNYGMGDCKALTVYFCPEKFRIYLLSSERLTVDTDQMVFKNAFYEKEINGRSEGRLEFLTECN